VAVERQPGESPQDFLRKAMQADGPITDDKKKEAQLPADPAPVDPPPVDPAAVTDPVVDPAAPVDPAAKVDEPKPAAVVPPNPLDKAGTLPAEKLATSFEDPEFAAAMEKQGYSKEQLMETARNAALAEEFVNVAGTPQAAKFAAEAATHFYDIEEGFTGIKSIQDFDKFMSGVMLPLSFKLGPDGQPLKKADGSYETDGTVSRFFEMATQYDSQILQSLIAKMPQDNEDVKDLNAALEIINNFRKNGYKLGAPPAPLTEEQKQREAQLAEREKNINTATANARAADAEKFEGRVLEATEKELETLIGATVNQSALSDALKAKATEDIYVGLAKALDSDRTFKQMARQARAHGMSDEVFASLVALNTNTLKAKYRDVAAKVMKEYGISVIGRNADERSKTDAQLAADRQNPKVGTTAARSTRTTLTADQIESQAAEEVLKSNGGKRPADYSQQLLRKIMEIEAKQNPLQVA
jgi:hypothetical protein